MGKYIYESHSGGFYTNKEFLIKVKRYCSQCCDYDEVVGYAKNRLKARWLLRKYIRKHEHYYTKEYIKEFLNDEFPKGVRC